MRQKLTQIVKHLMILCAIYKRALLKYIERESV